MKWHREHFKKGDPIFRRGDEGSDAYLIEQGEVLIEAGQDPSTLRNITLRTGEIFGEIALVDRMPRTASAMAAEDTTLIAISSEYFLTQFNQAAPLVSHLITMVVSRFRDLSRASLPGRVQSSELRDYVFNHVQMSQNISDAIELDEFHCYFQPIMHLADQCLAGFEALIRWQRPGIGMVYPGDFIDIAESTGLIVPMGRWMIDRAIHGLARLQARMDAVHPNHPALFMSINLSVCQLREPGEIDIIIRMIQNSGVATDRIKLEITESVMLGDVREAILAMQKIKSAGIQVAIDDFGTGYSSLSYLATMPIDNLKVDQSFVFAMREHESSYRIVRAITGMAHDMGMECIAEGIEDIRDADLLRQLGCKYGQGYHFAKPISLDQALDYIERRGCPD